MFTLTLEQRVVGLGGFRAEFCYPDSFFKVWGLKYGLKFRFLHLNIYLIT